MSKGGEFNMWVYNSPAGLMQIKFNPTTNKYSLIINGEFYEEHDSPISAADNVYMHVTGCNEWDINFSHISGPTDIYEWKKV
jgi:hypothetical protein